jgi:hypothetical protein
MGKTWKQELAYAFVFHPRDLGLNNGTDRKYFHILFGSNLNPNLRDVNSQALFKLYLYRHVAKNP